MEKFTEYIGSQFGNPRGVIGKICCIIMNTINRAMYKNVIACAKINKSSKVLDIGFGNGYLINNIYIKSNADICGIDISEDMLNAASKRNIKAIEEGKVHLSLGDTTDLQFDNEKFDVVTSVNTIYFWSDTVKGLEEIHRTLKKDGIFINAVYSKEWLQRTSYTKNVFKLFEEEDYISLGKKAGFSDVSIKEIINGKGYIIKFIK